VDSAERFIESDEERERRLGNCVISGLSACPIGCGLMAVVSAGIAGAFLARRRNGTLPARDLR
jgi:hypothetical protein